jgi:exodeoxyribonuclease VII small subunit
MSTSKLENIDSMSFEEALKELESVVKKLELGNESLTNVIELYQYGASLKSHCEQTLKKARASVEKITSFENGEIKTAPLDEIN